MHWRRSTWALIAWTALMLVWLVASASATATGCAETGGSSGECGAYAWVAAVIIGLVWLAVAVPLSILWYTRRRSVPARWGGGTDIEPR